MFHFNHLTQNMIPMIHLDIFQPCPQQKSGCRCLENPRSLPDSMLLYCTLFLHLNLLCTFFKTVLHLASSLQSTVYILQDCIAPCFFTWIYCVILQDSTALCFFTSLYCVHSSRLYCTLLLHFTLTPINKLYFRELYYKLQTSMKFWWYFIDILIISTQFKIFTWYLSKIWHSPIYNPKFCGQPHNKWRKS